MNLYLRFIWVLIAAFFKPKIKDITATQRLNFHVLPNDLDLNGHMNNGRYLTIMDLGRIDLIMRTGLMGAMIRQKNIPVLASAKMRFRLPLHPFQPYRLETQLLAWDEKWVYIEQRFVMTSGSKAGAVAAIGLIKASLYSSTKRETVPTSDLLRIIGAEQDSPPLPEYVKAWIIAEDHLKNVTKPSA